MVIRQGNAIRNTGARKPEAASMYSKKWSAKRIERIAGIPAFSQSTSIGSQKPRSFPTSMSETL